MLLYDGWRGALERWLDRLDAMTTQQRTARLQRETSESSIELELNLDGTGTSSIETSVPFYDHLLTAFAKHSLTDLTVRAKGDVEIDVHHTVEDIGIVLGQAIKQALGDKSGISRYGDALVPLDEALVQAVVDISGRPYLVHTGEPTGFEFHLIGGHFTGSMVRHVFEAITFNAGLTVHVTVLGGRDPHHIAEAEFKAFARAFRQAKALDPLVQGIPSTKGAL
ncbi:imidazoleglycerol-phosphate dehydratase HisB [Plantibacter sp. RU18]